MTLSAFRKIQIGLETTRGTAVAADKILNGTLRVIPSITRHRPQDERGSLAEYKRSVDIAKSSTLRWEGDATYERIIDFLSMGLVGSITPTSPGLGTVQRWTFTPSLTFGNDQDSYTFEYGDDTQVWEVAFVQMSNMELAIALDQVVTIRADLYGHMADKTTFTGSLTEDTLHEIIANDGKVYIDDSWANLGTTQKASLVAGATLRFPTGLTPVKYLDGSLEFSSFSQQMRHFELDLDLIVSTDAITEYDKWAAEHGDLRAVRLVFETTEEIESTFPYKMTIDMIGKYTSDPQLLDEREGESMFRLTLASHEDSSGNELSIVVDNAVSAV